MSKMKLWNGSQWVILDANDSTTLNGKNDTDFAPSSHVGSGGNQHLLATPTTAGFMSPEDKIKIDALEGNGGTDVTSSSVNGNILVDGSETIVYTHPATHPATMITQDANNRFVTDAEKTTWNSKADLSSVYIKTQIDTALSNKVDKIAGKDLSTNDYTTVEKAKLSNISNSATNTASSGTNGNIKIDNVETVVYTHPASHSPSIITQDSNNRFTTDVEKATWNAKASTTAATTSVSGLMSATDKTKLDGIATSANNYVHPTGDGNLHVPVTSTTNNGKFLKAGATAGSIAWANIVAADVTQDASNRFTTDAEKATWNAKATTSVVTTSIDGLMSATDKTKLDGVATGANNYVHPTTDGNLHVPATGTTNGGKFLKAGVTAGNIAWTTFNWSDISSGTLPTTLTGYGITDAAPLNAPNLTGVATAVTASAATNSNQIATTAYVKSQNYLTGNQTITASGDATGSGTTTLALTLKSVGTAGTYTKVTTDAQGRVSSGTTLLAADIPTLTLTKISDAGTAASKNTGTTAGTVPILDGSGKLDTSVLPALAITDTFVVASQVAMLALTAEIGDVAVRTDLSKSFILKTADPTVLANWQELLTPTDAVASVAGKTGVVTLTASDVGLGNVANESKATMFTSAALTGTSTAITAPAATNTTQIATTAYVKSQNYLTGNQTITASGDATGSGTTALALTLASVGTAGTYAKVTTDVKGRVISGTTLVATDIPVLDWTKITTGKPTTLSGYGITDAMPNNANASTTGTVTATRFISNIATGTSPFAVTSTTRVDNLNAHTVNNFSFDQAVLTTSSPTFASATLNGNLAINSAAPYVNLYESDQTTDEKRWWMVVDGKTLEFRTATDANASGLTAMRITRGTGTAVSSAAFLVPLSATTLQSTVATGTSPLTVASTTMVSNLNAERLNGQLGTYYAPIASPVFTGTVTLPSVTLGSSIVATDAVEHAFKKQNGTGHHGFYVNDVSAGMYDWLNTRSVLMYTASSNTLNIGATTVTATTPSNSDNSTQIATTAFVKAQSYLTANQTVTVSGDATGSGTTAIALTLANSGVTAGTYRSVTVDVKGRVTTGTNPTTLSGYGITDAATLTHTHSLTVNGDASGSVSLDNTADTMSLTLASVGTAGTYRSVTTDAKGRVTAGTNPTTLSGYGITDAVSNTGGTITGALTLSSGAPAIVFKETDQTLPAGAWRYVADGNTWRIDKNSAAAGDFSTYTTPLTLGTNGYLSLGASVATPTYQLYVTGDIYSTGWHRVAGQCGLFFQDYGGGWYMTDTTWIRNYGSKPVYLDNVLKVNNAMVVPVGTNKYSTI